MHLSLSRYLTLSHSLILTQSLYEVVTSERTYLKSLDVVVELFVESPELNQVLSPRDHKCLFSDISKIQQMSEKWVTSAAANPTFFAKW